MALTAQVILDADRRAGAALRRVAARRRGAVPALAAAPDALGPAFRGVVGVLVAAPAHRRLGVRALAAAGASAGTARLLRDRLARPRPGSRPGGGFPSRHAAAATAIAAVVARADARAGLALAACAAVGLTGRVVAAHHDPADILAGAALGLATGTVVARVAGGAR